MGQANEFYGDILGLSPRPVPALQKDSLAWFDIGTSGQQVHVACRGESEIESPRHPCFKIGSPQELLDLQNKIFQHYEKRTASSPRSADKPGEANSGEKFIIMCSAFHRSFSIIDHCFVQAVKGSSILSASSRETMLATDWNSASKTFLMNNLARAGWTDPGMSGGAVDAMHVR